jgi:hypothetical protein
VLSSNAVLNNSLDALAGASGLYYIADTSGRHNAARSEQGKAASIATLNPTGFPHQPLSALAIRPVESIPQLPAGDSLAGPKETHGLASGSAL